MNDDAIRWALTQQTETAGAKAVLLALSIVCDAEGRIQLTQQEVAKLASSSRRSARRYLAELRDAGMIAYEYDRDSGKVPVTYLMVGCPEGTTGVQSN